MHTKDKTQKQKLMDACETQKKIIQESENKSNKIIKA